MSQTPSVPRLSARVFPGLAILLAGVLVLVTLSGCKEDAVSAKSEDSASARAKAGVEELVWLEDFKQCLEAPGVPSELMNGMEDDVTMQLSGMDRSSICPCLSNGFAAAMDRKTTPNGTLRWMGNYPDQKIADHVNTARKEVASSCLKDPGSTAAPLPDMSETAITTLKEEAQRLHDEAGWEMNYKSCQDDLKSGINDVYSSEQCDCNRAKMLETFGYKRPFLRNSILSAQP